jgi:hypothetical protein
MSKKLSVDNIEGEVPSNENKGSLIYLGPNIPSIINRFTVYKDGMPKHLDKNFQDCPDIQKLFVPVAKLSEVLEKINKTGTPYNVWYSTVIEFAKKGVK